MDKNRCHSGYEGLRDYALPFGFEISPSNVVDEQRYVQAVESLCDTREVDAGAGGICLEGLDDPVLPESLNLVHGRLEFLLVATMDDEIETLLIEVFRQGLPESICGSGDKRIGLGTLLVLRVPVWRPEEVKPDGIREFEKMIEDNCCSEQCEGAHE